MVLSVSHMTPAQQPAMKIRKIEPMTTTRMDEIKNTLSQETIKAIIAMAEEQGISGKDEIRSQFLKPFCVEFEMTYGDQPTKEKLALKRLRNFINFRGVSKENTIRFTYAGHTVSNFEGNIEARILGWNTDTQEPMQIRAEGQTALAFAGAEPGDIFHIGATCRKGAKTIWAREKDDPVTVTKDTGRDNTSPENVLPVINCATVQELTDGELFGLIRCDVYRCNRFDGGAFVKYGDATVTKELETRAGAHVPLFQPGSEVWALVRAYYSKKHNEPKTETAWMWLIDGAAMPDPKAIDQIKASPEEVKKLEVAVTNMNTGKVTSL